MDTIERAEDVLGDRLAVSADHMMEVLGRISRTAELLRAGGAALDAGQWERGLDAIETESRDLGHCLRQLAWGLAHPVEGRR